MSHRDFMEFIAPAGTVLRDSPLQDAGTSTGTDSTRPVPAIKESQVREREAHSLRPVWTS